MDLLLAPRTNCFGMMTPLLGKLALLAGSAFCFSTLVLADVCEHAAREGEAGVFTIYDARNGPAKGWSHAVANADRFPLLAQEPVRYAVDDRSLAKDEGCGGVLVFRTILVRKMSNWGQQHVNGIEPVFFETPVKVEDLESVTLWVKFNSEGSSVPDAARLAEHYGPYLSPRQIEGLDTGLACIGLTFMEAGYNDQSTETLNAVYYATFDPETDFDRWIELTVPLADFSFGYERNYGMRGIDRSEALDRAFVGFRINPETTSGKVSRNYLNDTWDDSVPELYKEMSISLSRIEALVTAAD